MNRLLGGVSGFALFNSMPPMPNSQKAWFTMICSKLLQTEAQGRG